MAKAIELDIDFKSDQLAEEIANLYTSWDIGKTEAKKRWAETTQYNYATSTRETPNVQNDWSHSTHIPKITQIHDNLSANYMSALFPHEDWLKYVGYDQDSSAAQKRKVVEGYLKTKHAQNGFKLIIQKLLTDWIIYGNCFARVDYVVEKHVDPIGNSTVAYAGPRVSRISPYDIVFDPLANSFQETGKIVRSLINVADLLRDMEEKPELGYDPEIVKKAVDWRGTLRKYSAEEVNKTVQLRFDGFSNPYTYVTSNNVEILEYFGDIYDTVNNKLYKNHIITIIDRQWILRRAPMKTINGRPPIFHCGWRIRPDNLWAMGPLDNLVGMQYYINHLENARADAMDQIIFPTRVIIGDIEEEGIQDGRAGGKFISPTGEGDVKNLVPDTTILNADMFIGAKMDQMELFAGAPREAMGIRSPGEKTAFEVDTLTNAANRMFVNKTNYYEEEFIEKIVNSELEHGIRNLDDADTVAIDNIYGGVDFSSVTREDLTANGKLIPMGARHFAREAQLAQQLQTFTQGLQQDPLLAQHFPTLKLAKAWEDLLGFNRYELIQPFGRIQEEAEAQRLAQVASEDLQVEQQVDEEGNINSLN